MCSLAWCFFLILFFSINLICVSISIIVCLNKKNYFNKQISKHNQLNVLSFEIK